MGIALEFFRASIHWPPARLIPKEYPFQPTSYLMADLEQVHQVARARRTFDLEVVAVVQIELQQSADY